MPFHEVPYNKPFQPGLSHGPECKRMFLASGKESPRYPSPNFYNTYLCVHVRGSFAENTQSAPDHHILKTSLCHLELQTWYIICRASWIYCFHRWGTKIIYRISVHNNIPDWARLQVYLSVEENLIGPIWIRCSLMGHPKGGGGRMGGNRVL